jgi:hypothetical protein
LERERDNISHLVEKREDREGGKVNFRGNGKKVRIALTYLRLNSTTEFCIGGSIVINHINTSLMNSPIKKFKTIGESIDHFKNF